MNPPVKTIEQHGDQRTTFLVGGNMFEVLKRDFPSKDFFVCKAVSKDYGTDEYIYSRQEILETMIRKP